ncbi:DNA-binding PadR family transcriptional regulator [Endobacter medicaginis]|uniref:PadR family transcriptional regulator n=1 Tax=Endobacter medicaginis TaxID=1181271 RepID=A0A839V1K5_9PROT|nr:PadR family transcriptional regulator [Endobacter medicaginis]MBB3173472.1 DNA-binding PadR family transcriptional regulator [Endobacter medicaginis]MCX5475493.1 PadR family transcriptional regulator [Endobacter medicaginis]NVN30744.1 PadR family transcriptional regulator [Endobacter medicaginis]
MRFRREPIHDAFERQFDAFARWASHGGPDRGRDGGPPRGRDDDPRGDGRRGGRFGRRFGRDFTAGFGEHIAARKFTSAQLQLLLLALLESAPAHGYELIRELEQRSGGFYAPSPGMVYPALTFLDETGLAEATAEGNRKLYTITGAGRAHLDAGRQEVEAIFGFLDRIGGRMEAVREAFSGVGDADPAAAEELHRARHALKSALIRARGAAPDEARRIARILDEATRQILRPTPESER